MGRPRALVTVLAACLLVAGCGAGPSQVRAAILFSDNEVSTDQVQFLIDKAVQEQPAAQQLSQQHKLDQLGRAIVGQYMLHDAVRRAAQREGLVADENAVSKTLEQDPLAQPVSTTGVDPSQIATQIAYRARDHREVIVDNVLMQELGAKYVSNLSVTFDYTTVTDRDQAVAKANQMAADPGAATRLIQSDAATGKDASFGFKVPAVQSPDLAATVLYGVQPGTVVAFQPSSQYATWVVGVVRARDLSTPQSVDNTSEPTANQLVAIGARLLQPYVDASGAKINPRYGVWDPVAMNVAASEAETTGLVLSTKGSTQP
ncbi:hypothetical protein [Amycolatopsis acidicola]|nr:hypothetical protein [Amycolatopsis acidicola]